MTNERDPTPDRYSPRLFDFAPLRPDNSGDRFYLRISDTDLYALPGKGAVVVTDVRTGKQRLARAIADRRCARPCRAEAEAAAAEGAIGEHRDRCVDRVRRRRARPPRPRSATRPQPEGAMAGDPSGGIVRN